MPTTLTDDFTAGLAAKLKTENAAVLQAWPGEPMTRQPVHTVYGGAQLYGAGSAQKLGAAALRALDEYAPDAASFARALQLDVDPARAQTIYARVREKLQREPVEDQRIDYEDGYGNRSDAEEDGHAVSGATELAKALAEGTAPPFIGIRIKPLTDELATRSLRTCDLFLTTLVAKSGGALPPGFVVTLPKITSPLQVATLADVFDALEPKLKLPAGALKMELMIEVTQSIVDQHGVVQLPKLLRAGRGRVTAAHFGTYDYTASCNITAAHQHMAHPACDFAKHMMQVCYASTGIFLSDGATNVMPVPIHRAAEGERLTAAQQAENTDVVHRAWRLHYGHVQRSLETGFYQGWDLHPAQLPTRYAAVIAFFLQGAEAASARLTNFVAKAAQATLVGDVFDDAATGQGLLNYFIRAIACGAISEEEALKTGLTLDELRGRSFVKILKNRRGG